MVIAADERSNVASILTGFDFTFLPADPPRLGRFAAFRMGADDGDLRDDWLTGRGELTTVELVLPAGKSVRRRQIPCTVLPIAVALPLLLDLENSPLTTATARIWADVMTAGVRLIARGRLRPAVSPLGLDAWLAGPLDQADHRHLEELANAMPPLGHAV